MNDDLLIYFGNSPKKNKRCVLRYMSRNNKIREIHFGGKDGFTYVDGASEKAKENYIKCHEPNENWCAINRGSLARFILWGESRNLETNWKAYATLKQIDTHLWNLFELEHVEM